MMSEPIERCVSTTDSGVKRWYEPSRWLWKRTPSSVIFRRSEREKTWKPPESVRSGRGQRMNVVEAARGFEHVGAGAEVEVVRVAEDDLGLHVVHQLARLDGLHAADRPDGHEDGRLDGAVVGLDAAEAGVGVGVFVEEGERHGASGRVGRRAPNLRARSPRCCPFTRSCTPARTPCHPTPATPRRTRSPTPSIVATSSASAHHTISDPCSSAPRRDRHDRIRYRDAVAAVEMVALALDEVGNREPEVERVEVVRVADSVRHTR